MGNGQDDETKGVAGCARAVPRQDQLAKGLDRHLEKFIPPGLFDRMIESAEAPRPQLWPVCEWQDSASPVTYPSKLSGSCQPSGVPHHTDASLSYQPEVASISVHRVVNRCERRCWRISQLRAGPANPTPPSFTVPRPNRSLSASMALMACIRRGGAAVALPSDGTLASRSSCICSTLAGRRSMRITPALMNRYPGR